MQRRTRSSSAPPPAPAVAAPQSSGTGEAPAESNAVLNAQCPVVGPTTTPPWAGYDSSVLAQIAASRTGPHPADQEGYSHDGHRHDPNPLVRQSGAAPRQAGTQERSHYGVDITGTDVSPSAMDGASAVAAALFGHREDIQERLSEANVGFTVIPSTTNLPAVPGLESMANTCTTDGFTAAPGTGRNWEDVRGSGGTRVDDRWLVSMPEEGLVDVEDGSPWALHEDYAGYGRNHSVAVHEAAHILHTQGIRDEERERIQALYDARKADGKDFTSAYAGSNVLEYFAESVNAYLGVNNQISTLRADELAEHAPDWLAEHDPEMQALLGTILGTQEQAFDRARVHVPTEEPAAPAVEPASPAVS